VELSKIWPFLSNHNLVLLTNAVTPEGAEWIRRHFPGRVEFIPRRYVGLRANKFVDYALSFVTDTLGNLPFCIRISMMERPDALISTGCCTTLTMTLLCKIRGVKVVYVESQARLETPSFTGRFVYQFADLFLVQWESLLKRYGTKAQYWGSVI
jgi:UDP-N-acetylglucosamine:LPS N-acetylglucosamine transferase